MAEFDPSFFGMDSAPAAAPDAAPIAQDRSNPAAAAIADLNVEANRRLAAGDDPDVVRDDLFAKINGGAPKGWKTKAEAPKAAAQQFDPSFFGMPAAPTELPAMTVRPAPQPDATAIGDMPPDFGTGGGPLDLSPVGPALRTVGHQIAEETPRALAAGEASMLRFATALAPALAMATGNVSMATDPELAAADEQAAGVEKQVAQERAEAKAAGTSSPLSRAVGAVEQAPYTLAQYVGVPEMGGAELATAAVRSLPASYSAAKQKFMELQPQVGTAKALEAAGLTGIVNEVAGTLPLGAVGSAAERAAAGAIVGAGAEEAQRAGQNVILSDHPELQQQFDPEALVQQAAVGAGLGMAGGHQRDFTREEEVRNADEIPPDQRGVPGEGAEPQGRGEGGGQNLQFAEGAGNATGDAGEQVDHSGVPDSVYSVFPDMRPASSGLLPINNFTPAEQAALRNAGLVETGELRDENGNLTGETHEGVSAESLWDERQRRAKEAASRPAASQSADDIRAAIEKRASAYDRIANEQDQLGDLGDSELADKMRAKAAEIRAAGEAKIKEQARVDQNLQPERAGGAAAEPPAAGESGPPGAAPAGEAAQGAEEAPVSEAAVAEAEPPGAKPRVRVPVDEVPVSRVETQEPTPQPDTLAELDNVIRATKVDTAEQRAARGADAIPPGEVHHWETADAEAKQRIADDASYPGSLAAEVVKSKRLIDDTESMALLNDRVRLQNEHKAATQEAAAALESGNEVGVLRARLRVDQIENALDTNERAAQYSKSQVGRSLNATKAGMTEDYSLAHNVARARVAYGDNWSPSARAEIERLSNALEAKQAEVDAAKAAAPQPRGPARSPDERMQARMKAQIADLESTIKQRLTACPI